MLFGGFDVFPATNEPSESQTERSETLWREVEPTANISQRFNLAGQWAAVTSQALHLVKRVVHFVAGVAIRCRPWSPDPARCVMLPRARSRDTTPAPRKETRPTASRLLAKFMARSLGPIRRKLAFVVVWQNRRDLALAQLPLHLAPKAGFEKIAMALQ